MEKYNIVEEIFEKYLHLIFHVFLIDFENAVTRLFCDKCGTAIGTRNPMRPGSIILKVGTFDDPSIFDPKIAIFTIDKQKFHHIDDNLKCFDKRP